MEHIEAKKIVQSTNGKGWFGATYNMNIYKGCNQGCIYCDSRSSCYQIEDFDRVRVKDLAPEKVESELKRKRTTGIISMGGMNDPYNQFEKNLEYTRNILKSIKKYQFGVHCITKNTLLLRDIDLFKEININNVVTIGITITTFDDKLQGRIERNISSSTERFEAIRKLRDNNLFTGILLMPILPFINDDLGNIENIVRKAYEVGANYIYPAFGVTLRDNQRDYFFEKIGTKLTQKYIDTFGESYYCESPNSKKLYKRFKELCDKYNILYKMDDIVAEAEKYVTKKQYTLDI